MADANGENPVPEPRLPPGANPNRDRAQRRRNNRPRVKNEPRAPSNAGENRWADPLPDPLPLETQYTSASSVPFAGVLSLDPYLPTTFGRSVGDAFVDIHNRTGLHQLRDSERVSRNVHAQAYFKSCKQLYSTLPAQDKAKLQPVKGVFFDDSDIPDVLARFIAGIGNFDTKYGEVHIKHAPMLFMKWLLKGLFIDPNTSIDAEDMEDQDIDPLQCIWKDKLSLDYIKDLAKEWLVELSTKEFNLDLHGEGPDILVSYPHVREDWNFNAISDLYPQAANMRRMLAILKMTRAQLSADDPPVTGNAGENWESLLRPIGQTFSPLSVQEMVEEFNDASTDYVLHSLPHLRATFKMTKATATEHGYAGQIVGAHDDSDVAAVSTLPLSDADMEFGYIAKSALSFDFAPRYVIYGKKTSERVHAGHIANSSL